MPSPSTHARHRHSAALSLRPALQGNCRRCHSVLSSAFSYCYVCSQGMAGVRWARLAVHLAAVLIPAVLVLLGWRAL